LLKLVVRRGGDVGGVFVSDTGDVAVDGGVFKGIVADRADVVLPHGGVDLPELCVNALVFLGGAEL